MELTRTREIKSLPSEEMVLLKTPLVWNKKAFGPVSVEGGRRLWKLYKLWGEYVPPKPSSDVAMENGQGGAYKGVKLGISSNGYGSSSTRPESGSDQESLTPARQRDQTMQAFIPTNQ